jgi:outer membrane lipoprotein-sorting protein
MKCNYISENIVDMFDESISSIRKDELLKHLEVCPDCSEEYHKIKQAISAIRPKIQINASESLTDKVIRGLSKTEEKRSTGKIRIIPMFSPAWKKIASIAAVLVIAFALIPLFNHTGWFQNKSYAANALIKKSILAMEGIKSVFMNFKVRTQPGENFDFIDINAGFVTHKLWRTFAEPPRWRIEKPGRIVMMDGKNQYLYMVSPGLALIGGPDAGFMGWMKIFLDPMKILGVEKDFAEKSKAEYRIAESGNTFILTVKAKATGDFRNAYLLNSSVPESDSRRVYTFDKPTKRLISVEIFVESGNTEYQVIKVSDIRYDLAVPESTFAIDLPEGLNWKKASEVYNPNQTGVTAPTSEQVARMFFEACQKEDWVTVEKLDPAVMQSTQAGMIKKMLGGLTINFIGKSFKSGEYPGEFVPYEIRFKSGEIKKMNLALRNDNKEGKWYIDGGF